MAYLKKLLVAQVAQRRITEGIEKNEQEGMWKEVVIMSH
jgi:hypothetical protein